MNKRIIITIITGSILGVFCIIGAVSRTVDSLSTTYLFAFWFNRLLMGVLIGLLPINLSLSKRLVRGLILGLFVSFAFYVSTEFYDLVGFLAGGVYGVIIEFVAYKFELSKSDK